MRIPITEYSSKSMKILLFIFLFFPVICESKLQLATAARSPRLQTPSYYRGTASWYSRSNLQVKKHTANGEVFNDKKSTCASWYYPFGTYLKITNTRNGKSVVCRVNDRGPKRSLNRAIDLSKSGFKKIADLKHGLTEVTIMPIYF